MEKLSLLFTKDGLQYQLWKARNVVEEQLFFREEDSAEDWIETTLETILKSKNFKLIEVFSALNHFTLAPAGFSQHDLGYKLISYNAPVNEETEELMLSVNRKFGVQFYYAFPLNWYQKIKAAAVPTGFNFSGEKFLNTLQAKNQKEIHINLYHQQAEFFALNQKKVVLYNNLDATSEVDFLYFIMFSLSKIDFNISETKFFVYGETKENETFISELKKFVKDLSMVYQNLPQKNFILNS